MTEHDLSALCDGHINDAKSYDSSDLSGRREKALRYYEGDVSQDIPAQPGRSSVVSRDLADKHGEILPGLKRVFFGSDNIALYEPQKPQDEDFAKQATDYINYVVLRECDGIRHLTYAMSDGVLLGNGALKHYWDPTVEYTTESFT
ncbi:MAG: hypothetical protein M3R04_09895, partial [bacterium]|nr:hypothetical protein [bacterium]